MALKVLSALDTAKTQYYHFKAIIVAGMGMFTDAYDLFCIPPIMRLIARIYYQDVGKEKGPPIFVSSLMVGIPLLGTVIGKLVFGRLGDCFGRRRVYGLALTLMVLSSLGCGFSICTKPGCVLASLVFFRFLLGIGIGGDYPLSATIMSEFANKRTRGAFIAAVFSMQGLGIVVSSTVTMVVCLIFEAATNPGPNQTPKVAADLAWRLILMIGALPAALTCYWRMMMPETARYTALVEQNVIQAAKNMEKVLDVSLSQIAEDAEYPQNPPPSYPFFSKQFFRRHGRDLFSCSVSWFLVDIVFYSTNLVQAEIYGKYFPNRQTQINPHNVNAFRDAFNVAKFQALLAICSTIPGYWATVFLIDRIGRVKIQMMGFFFMALALFAMGIPYAAYWHDHIKNKGFLFLYGITFFFSNFGPNTTTFIVPAELFPARFRSTCHGISGAVGKVGAIIGAVGILWAVHQHEDAADSSDLKKTPMLVALLVLGGVCVVGVVVTYLFMFETMGRSLEENEKDEPTGENDNVCFLRCFNTGWCMAGQGSNFVREVGAD
ncbi:probable inorganic phosphate transporter 1-9 [Diospyros lotus]|uniref:probable inorganic phosphate transporter 1-9 n=1 Tax=Diospyros lotus TaxID=55363 RepID=UPI002251667E|nr:probable inorganic phosphate transporter 1-9 [Diospyros lotus]